MKKFSIYVLIGCLAFLVALVAQTRRTGSLAPVLRVSVDAPDSVQLAAIGLEPGEQLVAYAFGGSHCGFCNKPETKAAFGALRQVLTSRHARGGRYAAVTVVGVAIDDNLDSGLAYLRSLGEGAFDQVSVGRGWQNENVVRLIRQQRVANAGVPLVVVLRRKLSATLAPLTMNYTADSVVVVVQGSTEIADWVRNGARLDIPPPKRPTQLRAPHSTPGSPKSGEEPRR